MESIFVPFDTDDVIGVPAILSQFIMGIFAERFSHIILNSFPAKFIPVQLCQVNTFTRERLH
ncbi:MAG: hypothetical protein KKB25_03905 [Nanoarchaeota archaeon]|nr:hypothetical protein [Nanoarchaeota archaeon]